MHFPAEPVTLQLRQAPVHTVAQQTASWQWAFRQSPSALQLCPSAFRPQVPTVCPAATVQTCPSAQSVAAVAVVQLSLQAPLAQRKLLQVNAVAT